MSLESVLTSTRARPLVVVVLFILTILLFVADHVNPGTGIFVLATASLVVLTVISFRMSITQRQVEKGRAEREHKEFARVKELLSQQAQTGRLLVRRDLELSRANEHLRLLDQMKTDFVSVATHQLRTPLSAIRWTLSMLLNGDLGELSNEQKTFLMKAYESNNRMITLIGDMLFADHLESGKLKTTAHMTTVLPDLLDNLLLEIYPIAERSKVKVLFNRPPSAYPLARIDPPNMRAVMQNLIENAVKYTPAGGTVTIALGTDDEGNVTFSVADTGIGIPQDEQDRIFTRFYRAKNARKKETDGSGLGLFIARGIVKRYDGDIWFESTPDKGTTFHVKLPSAARASVAGGHVPTAAVISHTAT